MNYKGKSETIISDDMIIFTNLQKNLQKMFRINNRVYQGQ